MKLHDLKSTPRSRKLRYRAARGMAQGRGKQAGRGQSGQNKRTSVRPGFEGGQNPWYRRLPKIGFISYAPTRYEVISLTALEETFGPQSAVDYGALATANLIKRNLPIKILAKGQLTKPLTVQVDAASKAAIAAIIAAGGTFTITKTKGAAKASE